MRSNCKVVSKLKIRTGVPRDSKSSELSIKPPPHPYTHRVFRWFGKLSQTQSKNRKPLKDPEAHRSLISFVTVRVALISRVTTLFLLQLDRSGVFAVGKDTPLGGIKTNTRVSKR